MAPFLAEFVASAAMGYALNGVTAAVAVLEPPAKAELVDGALLFKALMFVLLCSFFSKTFARLSRSSAMNPAVLFLQRTVGGISTLQFLAGIVASTAGTCLGIFALTLTHVAAGVPGARRARRGSARALAGRSNGGRARGRGGSPAGARRRLGQRGGG